MNMYVKTVIDNNVLYERFCEDFVNSHTYPTTTNILFMNDHRVNVGRIRSLLFDRQDLVVKYSEKELNRNNFVSCMRELMLQPEHKEKSAIFNFECRFNVEAIKLITEVINDIPLFKRFVTEDEVELFFNQCKVIHDEPLIAKNNEVLAYFFSMLDNHALIAGNYQKVISTKRLVYSSSGKKYLSQADIANALSNFNKKEHSIKTKIDSCMVFIKNAVLSDKMYD